MVEIDKERKGWVEHMEGQGMDGVKEGGVEGWVHR